MLDADYSSIIQSEQNRTNFITSVALALGKQYNASIAAFDSIGVYPGSIKVNFTVVDEDVAVSMEERPLPDDFQLEFGNMSITIINGSFTTIATPQVSSTAPTAPTDNVSNTEDTNGNNSDSTGKAKHT